MMRKTSEAAAIVQPGSAIADLPNPRNLGARRQNWDGGKSSVGSH